MRKYIQILSFLLCVTAVNFSIAHDSNIATFQIRHLDNGQWVYEVMTPLHGLKQSLRASLVGRDAAVDMSPKSAEYKEKLIAHIKQGFDVKAFSADKNTVKPVKLALGKGKIKLDEHMSVLIFEIKGMPKHIAQLDFHLDNMSNNASQNNLLRLIEGERYKKYLLNEKNDFSASDKGFFDPVNNIVVATSFDLGSHK